MFHLGTPRDWFAEPRAGEAYILIYGRFDQGLRGLNSVDQFTAR